VEKASITKLILEMGAARYGGQMELPLDDAIGKIRGTSLVDRETGEVLATVD